MMNLAKNINKIKKDLPSEVTLVIAVKYATKEQIKEIISLGVKDLGFNTFQQLKEVKDDLLGVRIHFIGHLQSNKVKKLLQLGIDLVQSVDSYKLAEKINTVSEELGIKQKILLQVKTDLNKEHGFPALELEEVIKRINGLKNIQLNGLMTIPPVKESKQSFILIKKYFDKFSKLEYLSMGMSNDYKVAIKEGANMVRLGRVVFN